MNISMAEVIERTVLETKVTIPVLFHRDGVVRWNQQAGEFQWSENHDESEPDWEDFEWGTWISRHRTREEMTALLRMLADLMEKAETGKP